MGRAIAIDATATIGTVDKIAENVEITDGAVLGILELHGVVATNIQEAIPALVVENVALVAEEVIRVDDVIIVVQTVLTARTPEPTVMDLAYTGTQLKDVREKILKSLLLQRQTLWHSHKYFLSLKARNDVLDTHVIYSNYL